MHTTHITDYGARPNTLNDATPAVRAALKDLPSGGRLVFPQGTYHFWPERATERFLFVSNNDAGLRRIAFPLFGMEDIEVDGGGSEFVFHGGIVPFAVLNSANVRLHSFTMDWERTFHSEGEIIAVEGETDDRHAAVDLHFGPQFPFVVQNERLLFLMEDGQTRPLANALEFDPARRETAFQVHDTYNLRTTHQAREISPGVVRVMGQFGTIPTPGNVFVIVHTGRDFPGMVLSDSANVSVRDVTIHHAGAMGIVGQRTDGIQLKRVRVVPAAHKGRLVSTTADATHFVNCRGLIEMTDCEFVGQMDDATNVHGVYGRVSRLLPPNQLETELVHGQQVGLDITQAGDRVEFVRQRDLATFHHAEVDHVERVNQKYSIVTFTFNLPDGVQCGDGVASVGWTADVSIRGCVARGNRARGFLLSTPGKVVVENCAFHIPGASILIAGDANYWFESGAVRDVTIKNNHFDNGNFGVWGRAAIDICPEIEAENRPGAFYHRNITIDGNTFDAFDPRLVRAHCVDGLTVTNNIVRPSNTYPAPSADWNAPFSITDCQNVTVENNNVTVENNAVPGGSARA